MSRRPVPRRRPRSFGRSDAKFASFRPASPRSPACKNDASPLTAVRRATHVRDLVLFAALAWLIFTIPRRPWVGALAWVVFGVMYPHRLTWGPAYNFPFSLVIAVLTLVSVLMTKEHRQVKGGTAAALLVVFLAWSIFCNLFAFNPGEAFAYLDRVVKVFLMTFVLLLLIHTREQVESLLWCLVIALGFYGFKGGIFVLATGGSFMVMGPPDSPMEGNNSLGTGTVVIIPLMYYLLQTTTNRYAKWGLMVAMPLCAVSVLGSYSRGALLAIFGMGVLLWLRSRHKAVLAIAAVVFVTVAIPFMPDHWTDRMNTIKTYEEDLSAMQRLWAWETAYNIAKDRFPVSGGFEFQSPLTSMRYSPNPTYFHVAHSIYFQVLGSLGFVGLGIFLAFWAAVWRQASWLRKHCRGDPELQWAGNLGSMVQIALLGYLIGGAFLDIAFWDLAYYLFAALAGATYIARQARASPVQGAPSLALSTTPVGSR
jgi:putative inorganic carbon (HCO3(-)) transporter